MCRILAQREDAATATRPGGDARPRENEQTLDTCGTEAPMTTATTPGTMPAALPAPVEHRALQPVAAAPLLPRLPAAEARGGWPAEAHLPDEREDDEC